MLRCAVVEQISLSNKKIDNIPLINSVMSSMAFGEMFIIYGMGVRWIRDEGQANVIEPHTKDHGINLKQFRILEESNEEGGRGVIRRLGHILFTRGRHEDCKAALWLCKDSGCRHFGIRPKWIEWSVSILVYMTTPWSGWNNLSLLCIHNIEHLGKCPDHLFMLRVTPNLNQY